jgi:hypothetical protein
MARRHGSIHKHFKAIPDERTQRTATARDQDFVARPIWNGTTSADLWEAACVRAISRGHSWQDALHDGGGHRRKSAGTQTNESAQTSWRRHPVDRVFVDSIGQNTGRKAGCQDKALEHVAQCRRHRQAREAGFEIIKSLTRRPCDETKILAWRTDAAGATESAAKEAQRGEVFACKNG